MRLTLREIGTIGREIVAQFPGQVAIDGVAASRGESESVELLLKIHRSGRTPRTVMVGLRRVDRDVFEQELRRRIGALIQDSPSIG